MRRFVDACMAPWRSPKPVVAQVHGYCVAGGTDFALCCDLIVCRGLPSATRRRGVGRRRRRWMYRLARALKRLLLTGDATTDGAPSTGGWPSGSRGGADVGRAGARATRALLPNQAAMMKLLVNQASSRWAYLADRQPC
jgi:enoyl-CoA hydratase